MNIQRGEEYWLAQHGGDPLKLCIYLKAHRHRHAHAQIKHNIQNCQQSRDKTVAVTCIIDVYHLKKHAKVTQTLKSWTTGSSELTSHLLDEKVFSIFLLITCLFVLVTSPRSSTLGLSRLVSDTPMGCGGVIINFWPPRFLYGSCRACLSLWVVLQGINSLFSTSQFSQLGAVHGKLICQTSLPVREPCSLKQECFDTRAFTTALNSWPLQ